MSAPTTTDRRTDRSPDDAAAPRSTMAGDDAGPPPRLAVAVAVLAVVGALVVALVAVGDAVGWRLVGGGLVVEGGATLAVDEPLPEDVVLTVGDGGARVALPGADAELAAGTRLVVRGRVLVPESGALLVDAELRSVTVGLPIGAASGRGTFRVDRGGVDRVASYDAAVALDGDRPLAASRLDELVVDGGAVRLQPIRLDADDPWDRRHAARALATDVYAGRLATGLAATYGDEPQTAAFYADFTGVDAGVADVLPELAPRVTAAGYGPPADVLVAAAGLDALVTGTGLPLDEVTSTTLEERAAGATWGVVLARADLDDEDLRRAADAALRRRAGLGDDATPFVGPSSPSDAPDEAPTSEPPAGAQPDPDPGDGGAPGTSDPQPRPTTGPTPDDDRGDADGDDGGGGDDGSGPVEDLLDDVDDATDPVLDLLDDITDPVEDLLDGDGDDDDGDDGLLGDLLDDDGAVGGLLGGSGAEDDQDDADGGGDGLLGGLVGVTGGLLDGLVAGLEGVVSGT